MTQPVRLTRIPPNDALAAMRALHAQAVARLASRPEDTTPARYVERLELECGINALEVRMLAMALREKMAKAVLQ